MPLAKLESKTVSMLRRRIKRLVAAEVDYSHLSMSFEDNTKKLKAVVEARKSLERFLEKMDEPPVSKN